MKFQKIIGKRQALTRGIRLKGHIGAAGKLTSTWGELKSSNPKRKNEG